MSEWSKNNEFNSFNSNKGLLYSQWYQAIADKKFLPPIEASIDMAQHCNLSCDHCNAGRYIRGSEAMNFMDGDHTMNLIRFLGKWGVKATCFGGGGESTLHKRLPDALRLSKEVGMNTAVITNGTILNADLLDAYTKCRFISISVDAGTSETYKKFKGKELFHTVIDNMADTVNKVNVEGSNTDVCYKFLITEGNQHEIYNACFIARQLGVRDFYARPTDYNHQGIAADCKHSYDYDFKLINEQFEACKALETEDFRVFTVTHKYNYNFTPKKNFSQCYGAPVCIQICPDNNVYFCVDTRHIDFYKLGKHYPNPEKILSFWGGEKHKELVFGTGLKNCTSRCTYGPYCKQCEELFIKDGDPFCWSFT